MPNEDTGGHPLSQGDLPNLWGEAWKPRAHLDLVNLVSKDDVKNELIRFFAERHDGHLRLVGWLFDEVANEFEQDEWDGPTLHIFSESFASQLEDNLSKRPQEMGLGVEEIIPRRTGALHLNRRAKRLLIDVRLCLRRIAHAAAVTTEQRLSLIHI